jgi:hypothetical protein
MERFRLDHLPNEILENIIKHAICHVDDSTHVAHGDGNDSISEQYNILGNIALVNRTWTRLPWFKQLHVKYNQRYATWAKRQPQCTWLCFRCVDREPGATWIDTRTHTKKYLY